MPKRCDRCNGANAECNTDLLDVVAVGTGLGSTRGCSGKQLLMGQKSSGRERERERESRRGRDGRHRVVRVLMNGRKRRAASGEFSQSTLVSSLWTRFQTGNWLVEALPLLSRVVSAGCCVAVGILGAWSAVLELCVHIVSIMLCT
jgi:hypothetical protein